MTEVSRRIIHIDNYLDTIGLDAQRVGLKTPKMRDEFFEIVVGYLLHEGLAEPFDARNGSFGETPARIPKTAYVVRLSQPTTDELKALVAAVAALGAISRLDIKTLGVAVLIAVKDRVKRTRPEYGELSIIDALGSVNRPTADQISAFLIGDACRYPNAGCRYVGPDGYCEFATDNVAITMNDMAARGILRRRNAVEPIEFEIGL